MLSLVIGVIIVICLLSGAFLQYIGESPTSKVVFCVATVLAVLQVLSLYLAYRSGKNESQKTDKILDEVKSRYDFPPRKLKDGGFEYRMGSFIWKNQKTPLEIDGIPFVTFSIEGDEVFLDAQVFDERDHIVLNITKNKIDLNKNNSFRKEAGEGFFRVRNQRNEIAFEVVLFDEYHLAIRGTTYRKGFKVAITDEGVKLGGWGVEKPFPKPPDRDASIEEIKKFMAEMSERPDLEMPKIEWNPSTGGFGNRKSTFRPAPPNWP